MKRTGMFCIAALFTLGTCISFANAEVKVRSYYKGSKTESSLGKKKGTSGGKKQNLKNKGGGDRPGGRPPPEQDYEPGEILISNPPRGFETKAKKLGFSVIEHIKMDEIKMNIWRLKTPKGMSVPDALKLIGRNFPGATVDANHRFDLSAGKKGMFPQKAIGWSKVKAKCGRGVRIGMIDSAVDLSHPALKKQKVKYKSFHDPKNNPAPPTHGTAIAAMLIGKTMSNGWSGLLPGATLFAANMFKVNAQDKVIGNSVALLKGINWLAKQKVHVINLSIAGADNKMFHIATKFARKKGVILVASVGNWGYKKKPAYPAAYPDVFAVTAITRKRAIYSMANQGKYVDFSAPGVNVWTAIPGGGKVQTGTSFATPFISVLVGLDVARGVKPNPDKLRKLMRKRIIDLGKVGRDSVYGWGLINRKRTCMT
ncbi:MAG: S8 family serine peptidase [Alphaproteobacteria bacterium]|nr:S8 family serine peptidase [Alphaproteobacteria bacterium]